LYLESRNTSRLFYQDDEIVVVASERPVIQTVFNVPRKVQEIEPGNDALIKEWNDFYEGNFASQLKACSFERIFL
jgi:amidophosphoribosyltransferase